MQEFNRYYVLSMIWVKFEKFRTFFLNFTQEEYSNLT